MSATTVLDENLSVTSPGASWGRRPRVQGNASWGYNGADHDSWNANWNPIARAPNAELVHGWYWLVGRSYEQHRNNVLVSGPTDILAEAVGELVPKSCAQDPKIRDLLDSVWEEWSAQSGADGVSCWAEQCEGLVGNACMGGDVGVVFEERPDLGGPIPLRLNLVDAFRIRTPMGGGRGSETVNLGVVTEQGVHKAYYVAKDAGDLTASADGFYRFDRIRNGRPNFLLFSRPDATRRPGQSRATPIITAGLQKTKDFHDYDRSYLRSAGKRARTTAVIQGPDPDSISRLYDRIAVTQNPEEKAALAKGQNPRMVSTPDAATFIMPYGSGNFTVLPTETVDSAYPEAQLAQLRIMALNWKLPMEVCYDIWQGVNFSGAKILSLRKSRTAKRWRRKIGDFGPGIVAWRLMVGYLYAAGVLKDITPDMMRVEWHGPAEDYMDIKTEISAQSQARSTGANSPQTMASLMGRDALREETLRLEFADFHKKEMARLGLTEADLQFLNPSKNTVTEAESESVLPEGNPPK